MSKEEFIRLYVTQFLASYAAVHHADACATGNHDSLYPVEDAEYQANVAWDKLQEMEIKI